MKLFLFIFLHFLFIFQLKAQDFDFGKPDSKFLLMNEYPGDSTACAVVIKEFGDARISSSPGTPLVFTYHVKIKIFNSKGYKYGNVVIPIRKADNNRFETIAEVSGITIYTAPDGSMQSALLDPKKVYTENKNKYTDLVKFAMPNMTEGCTIEYTYQVTSPFIFNFRSWIFQWDIPKVNSEYLVHIPGIYNYNVSLRGNLKLSQSTAELEKECFSPGGGFLADCSKIKYSMSNIPALIEEDYMTAPENFRSAIYFELSDYQDYSGAKYKVTKEWKDIDTEIKNEPMLGGQLKKTDIFKDQYLPPLQKDMGELDKAKALYTYFQKWFKWNNYYGIYSDQGIRKALESHSGSSADINLALITALLASGLNTEAVLLSTRDNGLINKLYPIISDFNYLVAKVNIAGNSYLLDATDPLLPFGLLPLRCINDQGRVVSRDKASYWIDMKASQKESRTYNLDLLLSKNGKITGTLVCYSKGYEAYNKRKAIKKFNSIDEYVENLDERMPKTKITGSVINNLDSLENILEEKYQIEIDAYNNLDKESFSFNPFFMDPIRENPFKLAERTFPVDMGAPSDYKVSMTIRFPEEYTFVSKPQNVALALPENGGRYISSTSDDATIGLIFTQMMQLNKSVYGSNEYPYLKELFNRIVQVQKTDVVFRKK